MQVYNVSFKAYHNRNPLALEESLNRTDARKYVARQLQYYRFKGYPIITLEPGQLWEIGEPEDAIMVPDYCGLLMIDSYADYSDSETDFWEGYELENS